MPALIEAAIRAQPKDAVRPRAFRGLRRLRAEFEAVYFVLDAEYNTYMDIQQAINLRLMEEFARRGIELAYPTTSVQLTHDGLPPADR